MEVERKRRNRSVGVRRLFSKGKHTFELNNFTIGSNNEADMQGLTSAEEEDEGAVEEELWEHLGLVELSLCYKT